MYARRGYDAAMKYLSHYEQRLARLFDFLREHYVHAPDVYRLAEEAHLSPWHLHRLYHQVMGETLHETVKRMRLHRAAWLLLYSDRPVAAVARECGYQGNAQSFARVFRNAYGLTPHQFRRMPRREFAVELVRLKALPLLGLEHAGDYQRLGESYVKLEAILRLRGLMPAEPRVFALLHDDPGQVAEAELRSFIAVAGLQAVDDAPLAASEVPRGRYAMLHYDGVTADLDGVFDWFCGVWLAQTGLKMVEDAPVLIEFGARLRGGAPYIGRCFLYIPVLG